MATPSDRVGVLSAEIARYLIDHPTACDTLEGIVRWRILADGRVHTTIDEVSAALEHLVELGRVERIESPHGVVFRPKRAC